MNNLACKDCRHFQQSELFSPKKGTRDAFYGWCAKQSVYPATDPDGMKAPPDAKRAAPGERASPAIRKAGKVYLNCIHAAAK